MNAGEYTFVLDIPARFQADLMAGRRPEIQVNIDATAMTLAGNGATYIQSIVEQELLRFAPELASELPAGLQIRTMFNPNLRSSWFMSVMELVNNVTILAIILSGAAVIRERERGTIEHLLVMPVTPLQIMLAKVWANGLVIVAATIASIYLVVEGWLDVPVAGSVGLFAVGASLYLFSVTSLGIMLSTIARTMPQFGLLSIPVFVVLSLLSGGMTPLESMPERMQTIMQASPTTHFVSFSQAVLYRDAGLAIVWVDLLWIAAIGAVFFGFALSRFRASMSAAG
jgi:ABC-2 type transport system permease protein